MSERPQADPDAASLRPKLHARHGFAPRRQRAVSSSMQLAWIVHAVAAGVARLAFAPRRRGAAVCAMLWDSSARTRRPPPDTLAASGETRLPAAERELRHFVRQHEVCWETEPHAELVSGRRLVVGYTVRLFARHPRGFEADPAAPDSRRLQQRLADLAARVCPREWPAGLTVRFRPDAARLLLRPENEWAPEIAGCLSLQRTDATFAEADDAQKGCVHEIEHELAELGARPRTWRSR